MKTPNPNHPIRTTFARLSLASALGAAMFLGASPASATPVTTGLSLWLDASDASTMTLTGSAVTEWRDKNGSAAKMTLATGTPTVVAAGIGGIPTVHFTNGSSMGDGVNHGTPVTIFYVSRQTGGSNRRVLTGSNNWLLGYWGGNKGSAYFEGNVLLNGNGPSDTAPHLYATTIGGSGQNSTVWAEGVQTASNTGGTQGPNGLFLGGGGAYNEFSDCDISEVLVYNRILDSNELDAVGGYLAGKYGLTTTYPTELSVTLTSPTNNQAYLSGTSVSATGLVASGTAPFTVKFFTRSLPGGTFAQVGADLTTSPYTLDLGALSDGSYEIYAEVTDSAGPPVTDTSATKTFSVASATATTTTVATSGSPSTYGDSVTFTATVNPAPTGGTVQFYNGIDYVGGPVAVNTTTGEATVSTTTLGVVGPNEITAEYSGYQIYEASTTAASISQVVNKAGLTVTAQNEFRFQNTTNPDPLPYQITGFKNSQTLATSGVTGTPALSTTAVLESPVGAYPIICAVGDLTASNYDFAFVDAILTVADPATPFGINVNMDNVVQSGLEGPIGGLGAVWNTIAAASATNLRLASGPASTVGFTSSGTGGWNLGENNTEPALRMLKRGYVNFGANGTTQQLLINGLDPAKTYDLTIASAILITTNQCSRGEWFTTNTTSTVGNQPVDNTLDENGSTWVRGNNYVLFEDVVPNASGNITVNGFAITGAPYDIRLPLNGFQLVESAPATGGFDAWADANGATGQTPQQDHDNDGVENGIEFFMGETGSSFTAMPVLDGTNTIIWPASAAYEGTYEVQTSTDLATWVPVDPQPTASGGTLSYTLPPGAPGGKSFVRLIVTPTP
jgi:hypothetical protein